VSPQASAQLRRLPELEAVMPIRQTSAQLRLGAKDKPSSVSLFAVDAVAGQQITDLGLLQGKFEGMGVDGFAVDVKTAEEHHLKLGDRVPIRFIDTGQKQFVVKAIYKNKDLAGDYFVDLTAFEANVAQQFDLQVLVKKAPGVSAAEARRAIESVTDRYPTVDVLDRDEFKEFQAGFIDIAVAVVYGMLALAVIIALFGIANTIALSVVERTRELGLLRAVGMTRGQLRSSVRWEAFLVALFGCVGGLAVGIFFGWALMRALADEGLHRFDLPVVRLLVITVLASFAGVVAALLPARRAAKLDVLEAIAHG
jgi:putative ABC transport system permease protein